MSRYLHVYPTSDPSIAEYVKQQGASLEGLPVGRAATQQEFDEAKQGVESYQYEIDDKGGISLRRGETKDLYEILYNVVLTCGPQVVITDDMDLLVFTTDTTLDDLAKLDG